MDKENLELAEEHIKIAEDLVEKEGLNEESEKRESMKKIAFELEKAEAELKDAIE
jgi:hypothetical protein